MNDLNSIFPVTAESFSAPSVDGRKLHEWLGVGRDFTNWMKARIEKYGFLPSQDFMLLLANSGEQVHGGSNRTDYLLSVNMAKELGMVENSDRGREVRRYFLDCEGALMAQPAVLPLPLLPAEVAQKTATALLAIGDMFSVPRSYAVQEAAKIASQQSGIDLTPLLTQAAAMQNVPQEDIMLEPTELSHLFNTSAIAMNRKLADLGLQEKQAGQWVPTALGSGLCERHAWVSGSKSGYNLKWKAVEIEKMMGE